MLTTTYLNGCPKWDGYRSMIMKVALCISLFLCFCVINIEGIQPVIAAPDYGPEEERTLAIPPITYHQPPKKVPLPPAPPNIPKLLPVVQKIVTTDNPIEDTPDPVVQSDPEEVIVANPDPAPAPIAAPVIDDVDEDKVFDFVERMPIFGDCYNDEMTLQEMKECSNNSILKYVMSRLKYPRMARAHGKEGTVYLRFVVSEMGSINNLEIYKDIGMGCGAAAKKVLSSMPDWIPGKHNGRPVKVLYTIPIKFALN